jgi:hypothetical protein
MEYQALQTRVILRLISRASANALIHRSPLLLLVSHLYCPIPGGLCAPAFVVNDLRVAGILKDFLPNLLTQIVSLRVPFICSACFVRLNGQ